MQLICFGHEYGELQPATSNATREEREKNRRTEMRVLEQQINISRK